MGKHYYFSTIVFCALLTLSCSETTQNYADQHLNPKVWLHRANSIEKTAYYRDKFAGFEIDVQFNSNGIFTIKHGGFDENFDMTLEEWLQALDRKKKANLWLDFKNLCKDNEEDALKEIKRLRKKYGLKGTIYIESSSPECLKPFENTGFATSYYIPFFHSYASKEEIRKVADSIRNNVEMFNIKRISGFYSQYKFMVDSFPDLRKLTWYERYGDGKYYYIDIVTQDDKADVILIAVPDTIDYKTAVQNK